MHRARHILALLAIPFAVVAAAACSGGDSKKAPTPPGSFTGGGANVSITVGDTSWEYKDGICQKGGSDRYLSLNVGNAAGDEYFGLVAGQYPGVEGTPKAATGGGEFQGEGETLIRFRHERRDYLVKFDATKVTLAPDISSGSFVSELTSGAGNDAAVSGTFTCVEPTKAPNSQ